LRAVAHHRLDVRQIPVGHRLFRHRRRYCEVLVGLEDFERRLAIEVRTLCHVGWEALHPADEGLQIAREIFHGRAVADHVDEYLAAQHQALDVGMVLAIAGDAHVDVVLRYLTKERQDAARLRLRRHRRRRGRGAVGSLRHHLRDGGKSGQRFPRLRGKLQYLAQRLLGERVRILDNGGGAALALGKFGLHKLKRRERPSQGLRKSDGLRRVSDRGCDRMLAAFDDLLHEVALGVVRQRDIHRLRKLRSRAADDLTQGCELKCQAFGLAAAARAQLRPDHRGGAGNSAAGVNPVFEEIRGKPHLKAPARGIAGQVSRRSRAAGACASGSLLR
jgi:hypothetical protein